MASGLNLSGDTDPQSYRLGRGKIMVASLSSYLPDDNGFRDLGNAPEVNVTIETETLEHVSSREGTKTVDKEVPLSQKMKISFQIDEINFQNLALFYSGEAVADAITNPAVAGAADVVLVTSAPDLAAVGGRWYQLKVSGVRCYDIDSTKLSLKSDTAGDNNTLIEGTDYEVWEKQGMVKLLTGSTLIDEGDDVEFTLTADAGAVAPAEVRALTQTTQTLAILFIEENPVDGDTETEHLFHQVQLKPQGDFGLISDEFSALGFEGIVERNATADANSPYCTTRAHANG